MSGPERAKKTVTILWSLLIGFGLVAMTISVLLPSTKSSRMNFERIQNDVAAREKEIAAGELAISEASTQPVETPAIQPVR
jgi:hypothetical protein